MDKALASIASGEATGGARGALDLEKAQESLTKFSNELQQLARVGKASTAVVVARNDPI